MAPSEHSIPLLPVLLPQLLSPTKCSSCPPYYRILGLNPSYCEVAYFICDLLLLLLLLLLPLLLLLVVMLSTSCTSLHFTSCCCRANHCYCCCCCCCCFLPQCYCSDGAGTIAVRSTCTPLLPLLLPPLLLLLLLVLDLLVLLYCRRHHSSPQHLHTPLPLLLLQLMLIHAQHFLHVIPVRHLHRNNKRLCR
jgi:hypothetical protein